MCVCVLTQGGGGGGSEAVPARGHAMGRHAPCLIRRGVPITRVDTAVHASPPTDILSPHAD